MHTRRHRGCDYINEHGNQSHRHSQQRARDRAQRRRVQQQRPGQCSRESGQRISTASRHAAQQPCPQGRLPATDHPASSAMGRRRSQRASTAWRKAACCDEASSGSSASNASASWRARSTKTTTPAGSRIHKPTTPVCRSP